MNKEMQDKELENVAGGFCMKDGYKVCEPSDVCENWTCKTCGGTSLDANTHNCKGANLLCTFPCTRCKYSKHVDGYGHVCDYDNMTSGTT